MSQLSKTKQTILTLQWHELGTALLQLIIVQFYIGFIKINKDVFHVSLKLSLIKLVFYPLASEK